MEDDLKKNKKLKTTYKNRMEDEPINLIGCDTIVNSPSFLLELEQIKYPQVIEINRIRFSLLKCRSKCWILDYKGFLKLVSV